MLHHHRYMRHLLLSWPDFPETYGENYCLDTVKLIRKDPYKWLMSLPMYEYAHVLTVFTAHHLGGEPTQYVKTLYNRMLTPILTRYYRDLEWYRFQRSVVMRKYDNSQVEIPKEGAVNLKCKMKFCTCKVRAMLCQICEEYTWLKDLSPKHPKTLWLIEMIRRLAHDYEYERWMEELMAFIRELKDKDVNGYPGTEDPEEPSDPDTPDDPENPDDPTPDDPEDPPVDPDPDDPEPEEPEHPCDCHCDNCIHH